MTRAALHGDRMAWEALANFYPYEVDRYFGDADARTRGYAWAHLRSIPVHDFERGGLGRVWEKNKQKAWERLDGPDEQDRARALAARYERKVFPRLIRDTSALGICSLEPQFASDVTAARRIPEPVGPRPDPPDPANPTYKRARLPPVPEPPAGISVVSGRVEVAQSVPVRQTIRVATLPEGTTGIIERAILVTRDAPIFAERGSLGIQLYLARADGSKVPLVSAAPGLPAVTNAGLAEKAIPVHGGETLEFSCRSATVQRKAAFDKGCTVDVQIWIRAAP